MCLYQFLVILAGLGLCACDETREPSVHATFVRIVDGDTAHLSIGGSTIKVRLACVDAPEISQPGGTEAKEAFGRLLSGGPLEVIILDQDQYGRSVASISADGVDVGREMVRAGWAWIYRACRHPKAAAPSIFEDQARAQRAGLWAWPGAVSPWEYRKLRRGNAYVG